MEKFDYRNLDALFHSRIRLAAVAALSKAGEMDFNDLKDVTGATAGNLTTHMRKLEDARYVDVEKSFQGRKPRTVYRLTDDGTRAFGVYVENLAAFIGADKEA